MTTEKNTPILTISYTGWTSQFPAHAYGLSPTDFAVPIQARRNIRHYFRENEFRNVTNRTGYTVRLQTNIVSRTSSSWRAVCSASAAVLAKGRLYRRGRWKRKPARTTSRKSERISQGSGILEYWIVDPTKEAITVLVLKGRSKTYTELGTFHKRQRRRVKIAGVISAWM